MKIFQAIFLIIFTLLFQYSHAEIIEINRISEIEEVDPSSFVLFDVDFTLLLPKDIILHPGPIKFAKKLLSEYFDKSATYPQAHLRQLPFPREAECSLVEPKILPFIRHLQCQKIPVIAFTAVMGGELDGFGDVGKWRVDQLRELGLDFSSSFPKTHYLQLKKREDKEFAPLFKSGVLFSARHPKGEILKAFLEAIHFHPSKVILVDDRLEYLNSAEKTMIGMGIPFTGYHYRAVEKIPVEYDEKVARFQLKHLARHGKWLSDEEVKKALYNNP